MSNAEGVNNSLGRDEVVELMALLKACTRLKDEYKGRRLHAYALKMGILKRNNFIGNTLVNMYAKFGALAKAQEVFDGLCGRDVVAWTALIAGYAQHGQGERAVNCFEQMQCEGLSPNAVTFGCILKACGNLGAAEKGEEIHAQIVREGLLGQHNMLNIALVDMYAKCGALSKAQQVFDELSFRNIVSWTTLIAAYAQHEHGEEALICFEQMQREGFSPNAVTFTCILKACGSIGATEKGKIVHAEIVRQGLLEKDIVLGNALVDMYVKFGALAKAQQAFEELPVRNVVSWNTLIAGYAQHGHGDSALSSFERMQRDGLSPNAVTFACVLKACGSLGVAEKGKVIHDEIVRKGLLGKNNVLGNALVDMYVKCGALARAQQVFDELPFRNIVSWTALMAGYTQHEHGEEALNCFERMQREDLSPNGMTFACILKACGSIGAVKKGNEIHAKIVRQGLLGKDIVLGNALVDMYAKCGALANAQQVFDELHARNAVSWNGLIAGYSQHGHGKEALNRFKQMQDEGICPDTVTFICILSACSDLGLVDEGQMYFNAMTINHGIIPTLEHYTCMVNLFGCGGHLDKATEVMGKPVSCDCLPLWFALLGACQRWGNVKLGRLAFECAVQLDGKSAVAYVHLSNIYAAAGNCRSS